MLNIGAEERKRGTMQRRSFRVLASAQCVASVEGRLEISLHEPQMVSVASVKSVDLLHWGLTFVCLFSELICYTSTLHHVKNPLLFKKEDYGEFANVIKETTKRLSPECPHTILKFCFQHSVVSQG